MTTIFQSALRHLASLYDMPELLAARITEKADGSLQATIDATPRGQIAAMVATLQLTVNFAKGRVQDLCHLRLDMSYTHHNGGSNGKTMDYTILTEPKYGEPVFVTMLETNALHGIASRLERHAAAEADRI